MSSYTISQKRFTPVPPLKGSFPLDHEGLCRSSMIKYMRCLAENRSDSGMCRNVSKDYLECRMENGLMAREEWSKLGFSNEIPYKPEFRYIRHITTKGTIFSKLPSDANPVDLKRLFHKSRAIYPKFDQKPNPKDLFFAFPFALC